jgi:hypothetical protein
MNLERTRSALPLLAQFLAWPLLGFLIFAFDDLAPSLINGFTNGAFRLPPGSNVYVFLQWGLFTPIVVQLALRLPVIDRPLRNGGMHVIAAVVLCLLRIIGEPNRGLVIARIPAAQYLGNAISRDLLIYASIAVAAHLFLLERRRAVAEREALAAQMALATAERTLLEQTVAPERIIRNLDEIAHCIRHEPSRVESLIETFSEFLRSRIARE